MKEEYNRVLSNPDNVIVSEGLEDILSEAFVGPDTSVLLNIGDDVHIAELMSFSRSGKSHKFELSLQPLSVKNLSFIKKIFLTVDGIKFICGNSFEYVIHDGKSILILNDVYLISERDDGQN